VSRPVYVSTACVRTPFADLESQLDAFAEAQLHSVELGWSARPRSANGVAALVPLLGARREARGDARFLVHNYFPQPATPFVLNLASQDAGVLRQSRAMAADAIALSAALGAPYYSVHAGFLAEFDAASLGKSLRHDGVVSREAGMRTFTESVAALADAAAAAGIDLLIEPNVVERRNLVDGRNALLLLAEAGEITAFLSALGKPNVGILLDTGHLNVTATTLGFPRERFIDEVAPFVRGFHVHDNDGSGDQHRACEGGSWVLALLAEPRFRGRPAVIEAGFPDLGALARYHDWFIMETSKR
jgi:sugar phosphate isomerase/epimerase